MAVRNPRLRLRLAARVTDGSTLVIASLLNPVAGAEML